MAKLTDKIRRSTPGLVIEAQTSPRPDEGLVVRDSADNQLKFLISNVAYSLVAVSSPDEGTVPQFDLAAKEWKKVYLPSSIQLIAQEIISKNDVVYIDPTTAKAKRALGSDPDENLIRILGVAKARVEADELATIQTNQKIAGFSGLIPGALYYLDNSTYGAISTTSSKVQVGVAISTTELQVEIKQLARALKYNFADYTWEVSSGVATLTVTHGLRSTEVYAAVYTLDGTKTETGVQIIDENTIALTIVDTAAFSGYVAVSLMTGGGGGGQLGGIGSGSGGSASTVIQNLGSISGAVSIDWAPSQAAIATLSGNTTITMQPLSTSMVKVVLQLTQDSSGSKLVTWGGPNIKWPGGLPPDLTTTANASDLLEFTWNGTSFLLTDITTDLQ